MQTRRQAFRVEGVTFLSVVLKKVSWLGFSFLIDSRFLDVM